MKNEALNEVLVDGAEAVVETAENCGKGGNLKVAGIIAGAVACAAAVVFGVKKLVKKIKAKKAAKADEATNETEKAENSESQAE